MDGILNMDHCWSGVLFIFFFVFGEEERKKERGKEGKRE